MQNQSEVPLVGGNGHGQTVSADQHAQEIDIDVHTSEDPASTLLYSETYIRRHFKGEGFGEGFDCFALKSDDATEQKELARWSMSPSGNEKDLSDRF